MKKNIFTLVFFFTVIISLYQPKPAYASLRFFDSFSNGLGSGGWTINNDTSGNTVTTEFDNTDPQHGYFLKLHYSGTGQIQLEKQFATPINGEAEVDFYDYGNAKNEGTFFSILDGENFVGLGLNTTKFTQTYYYRINNQEIDTGIQRTIGIHHFRLITSPSGSWGEIDGVSLEQKGKNSVVTQIEKVTIEDLNWVNSVRDTWYDNVTVKDSNVWQLPHQLVTDQYGLLLPWTSYDNMINLLWNYWKDSPEPNGAKNYLQYRTVELNAGADGDQLVDALSSWRLLYQYSGNPDVLNNMKYIADFYLANSLSGPSVLWPNIPFTSNSTNTNGNIYNPPDRPIGPGYFYGDLIKGPNFTRLPVVGDFGSELVPLYQITGNTSYLTTAIHIADTLAGKVKPGDGDNSPLPFRVNVNTGQITDTYTSDWTGTLLLFDELIQLNSGNISIYDSARNTIRAWLKNYPMKTNKWGPTFSDVTGWSNTETNADMLAGYILKNPGWDPDWKLDARTILNWTETAFGNSSWNGVNWSQYGVLPINEQTEYPMPGNSHTARHGLMEILYAEKTGDDNKKAGAVRELNWATYMVNSQGANYYPENKIWYEDGYGDFIRHYLNAMEAAPELAAQDQNHLLGTSSTIKNISYGQKQISYSTFYNQSQEILRINFEPIYISAGGENLPRLINVNDLNTKQGYTFNAPGDVNGVLRIRHDQSGDIVISATSTPTTTPIPGDFNNDGLVNFSDYTLLKSNFGNPYSIYDYNTLVTNFSH